jgi:hypothetical protein
MDRERTMSDRPKDAFVAQASSAPAAPVNSLAAVLWTVTLIGILCMTYIIVVAVTRH